MASGRSRNPAGLELAYDLEKSSIENALDAFVLSLHWSIVRTGLRQRGPPPNNDFTERLPPEWTQHASSTNSPTRTLTLNYYDPHKSIRYELKVIELTSNDMVAVTFFRNPDTGTSDATAAGSSNITPTVNRPASERASGPEKNSAAATFQIGNFIRISSFGENTSRARAEDVYEHADSLETQFYESVMEPLGLRVMGQPPVPGPYDDKSKAPPPAGSSDGGSRHRDPLADDRNFRPDFNRRPSPLGPGMPFGPLYVPPIGGGGGLGRSDLDPMGRFGAGNVLDPRGMRNPFGGGIPMPGIPGGIPPGTRFDPFGPPNPNRPDGGAGAFALPNPDRERPPSSDYDDMFM